MVGRPVSSGASPSITLVVKREMTQDAARKILITGAAGTGTTTLAQALATALGATHLEADDFLWLPTRPPYQHLADKAQRDKRLLQAIRSVDHAVVAGSVMGWGQVLEDEFDLVVFLYLPVEIRLQRLERREIQRFGSARPEFLAWAAQYDAGNADGRSLGKHQQWLSERACPVLRLEGDMSIAKRLRHMLDAVESLGLPHAPRIDSVT